MGGGSVYTTHQQTATITLIPISEPHENSTDEVPRGSPSTHQKWQGWGGDKVPPGVWKEKDENRVSLGHLRQATAHGIHIWHTITEGAHAARKTSPGNSGWRWGPNLVTPPLSGYPSTPTVETDFTHRTSTSHSTSAGTPDMLGSIRYIRVPHTYQNPSHTHQLQLSPNSVGSKKA